MRIVPYEPSPLHGSILGDLQFQGVGQTQAFRPRGTKDWLMALTLSGQGYVCAEGRETEMERGSLLLIAPGTVHDYGHLDDDGAWCDIWVHFHPRAHWLPWLDWPQLGKGTMLLDVSGNFASIEAEMRLMLESVRSASRLRDDAALNSLERVILLCDALNPLQATTRLDLRIRRSLDIVAADGTAIDRCRPKSGGRNVALSFHRPVHRTGRDVASDLYRKRSARPCRAAFARLAVDHRPSRRADRIFQRLLFFHTIQSPPRRAAIAVPCPPRFPPTQHCRNRFLTGITENHDQHLASRLWQLWFGFVGLCQNAKLRRGSGQRSNVSKRPPTDLRTLSCPLCQKRLHHPYKRCIRPVLPVEDCLNDVGCQ